MNRKIRTYAIIWAILLAVFNLICFVTPQEISGIRTFGGAFWVGYLGITAAFLGQLVCAYFALRQSDRQKLFYRIPLIRISYAGLLLMFAVGGLAMAIPNLPNWAGVLACALVLAFTAIAVLKANAAAELVEGADAAAKTETSFLRGITVQAEQLAAFAVGAEAKAQCRNVYEALRYSDPCSTPALAETEAQIIDAFLDFQNAIKSARSGEEPAAKLLALIAQRNAQCKAGK